MVYLDIISGFLGVGKTTFINTLLDFYVREGERPAYIVNEYGEAAMDANLMREEGFQSVEIIGGCICCTLRGKVADSIASLIEEYQPTRIVFEPSGVFRFDNFFDVLQTDKLKDKCMVGNVITVVDAANYQSARLEYGNFIYSQIENAPILMVSKLDLADETKVSEVICDVKNINKDAFIIAKTYDQLTDDYLREVFTEGKQENGCCTCGEEHEGCCHDHDHDHEHHHGESCGCHNHDHAHDHDEHIPEGNRQEIIHEVLDTLTMPSGMPVSMKEAEQWVEDIKNGKYGEVVRSKGIFMIEGKSYLVNIAFGQTELKPYPCMTPPQMTIIGKKLRREDIGAAFNWKEERE